MFPSAKSCRNKIQSSDISYKLCKKILTLVTKISYIMVYFYVATLLGKLVLGLFVFLIDWSLYENAVKYYVDIFHIIIVLILLAHYE